MCFKKKNIIYYFLATLNLSNKSFLKLNHSASMKISHSKFTKIS